MDKVKYLLPRELTISQLATIVRNKLGLCQSESLFLLSSSGDILQMTMSVQTLYTSRQALYKELRGVET